MSTMIPLEVARKGSEVIDQYISLKEQLEGKYTTLRESHKEIAEYLREIGKLNYSNYVTGESDWVFARLDSKRITYNAVQIEIRAIEEEIKTLETP